MVGNGVEAELESLAGETVTKCLAVGLGTM